MTESIPSSSGSTDPDRSQVPKGGIDFSLGAEWLTLLLSHAEPQMLVRQKEALIGAGAAVQDAERQLALALELRHLLSQHRRRTRELTTLNTISRTLAALTDAGRLLTEIVEHAKTLLQVDLVYLGLIENDRMVFKVTSGQISAHLKNLTMPVSEGVASVVIEQGGPVWTHDYRHDERFAHHGAADFAARSEDVRGVLGVPLWAADRVIGVLFAVKRQERHFASDEIDLLSSLAAHASIALENSRVLTEQRYTSAELRDANERLEAILSWDNVLTDLVLDGCDITDLLAAVSERARCPAHFVLSDSDEPPPLDMDREAFADVVERATHARAPVRSTVADADLLAMPVAAAESVLGVLILERAAQHIDQSHSMIIERAAPSLALVLLGEHSARQAALAARDAILVELLTRPPADHRETTALARLVGLHPGRAHSVAVALPDGDKRRVRAAIDGLALPTGSVVGEFGRRVVVIIPETAASRLAKLWSSAGGAGATVGISGPAAEFADLAHAFREAAQTVDVMLTLGRSGHVGTVEALGVYRILLMPGGKDEISRLRHQQLGPLIDEQKRTGVQLLETLESYLRNSQRHAATAAQLGIHSNTLYQRLDRITSVLGPSWRHPDNALDLQVVLRLSSCAATLFS